MKHTHSYTSLIHLDCGACRAEVPAELLAQWDAESRRTLNSDLGKDIADGAIDLGALGKEVFAR